MPRNKSTILFIAVAAILAVAIIASFFMSLTGNSSQGIVLPDESANIISASPSASFATNEIFASINSGNVQKVISTLVRPSSYHRKLSIETIYAGGKGTTSVEVWSSGSDSKSVSVNGSVTKNVLVLGDTVYTWYDGKATKEKIPEGFLSDDFQIMPTYEDVLEIDPKDILNAAYVDLDGAACIYVEFTGDVEGTVKRYWISIDNIDNGLLVKAMNLENGNATYTMKQDSVEILSASDEIFSEAFKIPEVE